jgi:hypothetical protein
MLQWSECSWNGLLNKVFERHGFFVVGVVVIVKGEYVAINVFWRLIYCHESIERSLLLLYFGGWYAAIENTTRENNKWVKFKAINVFRTRRWDLNQDGKKIKIIFFHICVYSHLYKHHTYVEIRVNYFNFCIFL